MNYNKFFPSPIQVSKLLEALTTICHVTFELALLRYFLPGNSYFLDLHASILDCCWLVPKSCPTLLLPNGL